MRAVPLTVLLALAAAAQQTPPAAATDPATKLAQPVFAGWHLRLDDARADAAKTERLILAYCTRTDVPCAPCDAAERGLLRDPRIAALADQVVRFAHCRTGDRKRAGDDLAATLGLPFLPALALLDAGGGVVARFDLDGLTAQALVRAHDEALGCIALAQTLQGLPADEASKHAGDLLVAEAKLRKYGFVELDQKVQVLGAHLTRDQRDLLAPILGELECAWLLQQHDMPARERADRMQKLFRDRRRPTPSLRAPFWTAFGNAGDAVGDPVMLDVAAEMLTGPDVPAGVAQRFSRRADELRRR